MISDTLFIAISAGMLWLAYHSIPGDDDVTPINILYGLLATWLSYNNAQVLLTDHIQVYSDGVAYTITSGLYYWHYLSFAAITGIATVYLIWLYINNIWSSGDTDE